jgi:hypothetical protein
MIFGVGSPWCNYYFFVVQKTVIKYKASRGNGRKLVHFQ